MYCLDSVPEHRTASPRAHSRRAITRESSVFLVTFIAVVLTVATSSVLLGNAGASNTTPARPACDPTLASALQASQSGLCLQNVQVIVSPYNSSDFVVPVMIMKAGTSTSLEILYLLSSESIGEPLAPHRNVTSAELPIVISAPSAVRGTLVQFSNASLIFATKTSMIYKYTVTALPSAKGYFAILPPFYYGMYPVLAVGVDSNDLNSSILSTWGYSGTILSSEVTIPSRIVGTGELQLVNQTVPMVPYCTSQACVVIERSGV